MCGGRYCPPTTSGVHLFTGFPDGKPIKVVTDSIGKALPTHKLWSHHALSGKTFKDATERIISGDIRVGGLRVIAFHLGTNSMDHRGWVGRFHGSYSFLLCRRRLRGVGVGGGGGGWGGLQRIKHGSIWVYVENVYLR